MKAPIKAAFGLIFLALAAPVAAHAAPSTQSCVSHGTYQVSVPGAPFSAIATPDGQYVFVSVTSTNPTQPNGIAILACQSSRYQLHGFFSVENEPTIMAITSDGKTLVVPDDNFIAFVDVSRALAGAVNPIVDYFEDIPGDDGGAVYASVTPDARYAIVAEEQSGKLSFVDLSRVGKPGFDHSAMVSEFLIGNAPVALVFSRDGKYLFATVQVALKRYQFPATCTPENAGPGAPNEAPGAVVTIDLARAIPDPDHAITSYTPAGCHPVRAALTPDGRTLWVSARASNTALAFSADKLIAGAADAKVLESRVGAAPVPILVTPDGRYVLVANSNRFGQGPAGDQSIDVIDASDGTVKHQIPAGKFPRQFTETRNGSAIFLCNFGSDTVQVIDPTQL